jgi:tetratricopeptide (TPR) repeat protein
MEFSDFQPAFDDGWIAQCDALVESNGGIPPHINYGSGETYAHAIAVDADTTAAMEQYLREHASDMASRFAVLRYLWTSWLAGSAADDENAVEEAVRAEAHTALLDFVGRLAAESIATPGQAMWEFKQAFILSQWERLKRLGRRYATLAGLSRDDLPLLLARALWCCNSRHWASVTLSLVTGREDEDLAWEPLIDGDQLLVSRAAGLPPEPHEAALSKDLVLFAIDCMRNVQPETMGPHWGILADCEAMMGMPGRCAEIWEKHGAEILKPVAQALGRLPVDVLSGRDYQFPIADLWEEAGRADKAIETLEALRSRRPSLQGVNRRLADCYLLRGDLESAAQRIQDEAKCDEVFREDSIVRLLLRQCGKAEEAERRLKDAQEKYESSPLSTGQRTAIRNVLQLTWKPFARLSLDVQSRWIMALHWCYGEHPSAFSDTERAGRAIGDCTAAFEAHLRESVFEPLRDGATQAEIRLLPERFQKLRSFLSGGKTNLGEMLDAIAHAKPAISGTIKRLWDLLNKSSSRPYALQDTKYLEIPSIRNRNAHDCRIGVTGISIEEARRCIDLCQEFLTILETPPPPPPRPGQPVATR